MKSFIEYLTEGSLKWKMNKTVSKENAKLVPQKAYIPEIEYVSGKYVIIRLGTSRSEKWFMMINDGKARELSRGGIAKYSKLADAKRYFEEL